MWNMDSRLEHIDGKFISCKISSKKDGAVVAITHRSISMLPNNTHIKTSNGFSFVISNKDDYIYSSNMIMLDRMGSRFIFITTKIEIIKQALEEFNKTLLDLGY